MEKSGNKNVIYSKNCLNFSDYIDIPTDFVECVLNSKNYTLIVCCPETKIDHDILSSIYRYSRSLNCTIHDFLELKI